jgi:hypothetical protein
MINSILNTVEEFSDLYKFHKEQLGNPNPELINKYCPSYSKIVRLCDNTDSIDKELTILLMKEFNMPQDGRKEILNHINNEEKCTLKEFSEKYFTDAHKFSDSVNKVTARIKIDDGKIEDRISREIKRIGSIPNLNYSPIARNFIQIYRALLDFIVNRSFWYSKCVRASADYDSIVRKCRTLLTGHND